MKTVKDTLWIWGHPVNSLKHCAGLEKDSDVSALDAMYAFGAGKIFYVPMGRALDRVACNREMAEAGELGWSIESAQDVEALIAQKADFPNLTCGIFDDFFSESNAGRNYLQYSLEQLIDLREKMHSAGLEMWVVFYTMQVSMEEWKPYLSLFDGVTYWFWDEPDNDLFDEKCRWFVENTPNQKRMIGCYFYNFGQAKEATVESVRYQLDRDLEMLKDGTIEGIILHTNAVGGMGFAAYDEALRWTAEHGDDEIKV